MAPRFACFILQLHPAGELRKRNAAVHSIKIFSKSAADDVLADAARAYGLPPGTSILLYDDPGQQGPSRSDSEHQHSGADAPQTPSRATHARTTIVPLAGFISAVFQPEHPADLLCSRWDDSAAGPPVAIFGADIRAPPADAAQAAGTPAASVPLTTAQQHVQQVSLPYKRGRAQKEDSTKGQNNSSLVPIDIHTGLHVLAGQTLQRERDTRYSFLAWSSQPTFAKDALLEVAEAKFGHLLRTNPRSVLRRFLNKCAHQPPSHSCSPTVNQCAPYGSPHLSCHVGGRRPSKTPGLGTTAATLCCASVTEI